MSAEAGADQLPRHRIDELDELDRQQAERDAAERQPDHADALPARRRRAPARASSSRGWPRKIDAEELDHRVAGQRRHQRDQRRDHRHQHVQQRSGSPGVNRKLCSSSHSETKPLSGGSPALASTPTSVEPGDPRHAADQPAELAEAALARWRAAREPVPRNSRLLKNAWLATWYSAAVSASAASSFMP